MKYDKHIVLFTPGFPNDETDTASFPYLQTYYKHLAERFPNILISIITIHFPIVQKKYDWYGIPVYACGGNNRKIPIRLKYWWRTYQYLREIQHKYPIDYIHSFWLRECALLGDFFAKIVNAKHLVTLMGQDAKKKDNRYLRFFNLPKMNLVALSNFQARIFYESTGHQINTIIPWGLNKKNFNQALDKERPFDVIGIGNLGQLKNFHLFIKIIKNVKKLFPNIRACIIGEGPQRQMLEQQLKVWNLTENVVFKGYIPREKVIDLIYKSKILLHPSTYESHGYVFSEALYAGCYVISFAVGVAQASERWKVVQNEAEMTTDLLQLLQVEKKYIATRISDVEETVTAYANLYNL